MEGGRMAARERRKKEAEERRKQKGKSIHLELTFISRKDPN